MKPTKRALGVYLGIVVAAFGIAGFVLNGTVANRVGTVSTLLLAAAILEIAGVILVMATGPRPIYNLISIVTVTLFAYALVLSFSSQMNQLGNVVAGLDEASSLQHFLTFVAVTGVGLLLSIITNFLGKAKSA